MRPDRHRPIVVGSVIEKDPEIGLAIAPFQQAIGFRRPRDIELVGNQAFDVDPVVGHKIEKCRHVPLFGEADIADGIVLPAFLVGWVVSPRPVGP